MYRKEQWKDLSAQHPERYREVALGGGLVNHFRDIGEVYQEGTPVDAEHMNGIETGIMAANLFAAMIAQAYLMDMMSPKRLTASDVGAVPETRKINGYALDNDIDLDASDVGAAPDTRRINGHALDEDFDLSAADVNAFRYMRMLTSADDLDDLRDIGIYYYGPDSVPRNVPNENWSVLEIMGSDNIATSRKIQRVTRYGSINQVYVRGLLSGSWSEWTELFTSRSNIHLDKDAPSIFLGNITTSRNWQLVNNNDRNSGFYDDTAKKWVFKYDSDGAVHIDGMTIESGETIQWSSAVSMSGIVSGSSKNVLVTLFLGCPINASRVDITSLSGTLRSASGFLNGNSATIDLLNTCTCSAAIIQRKAGIVRITVVNDDGFTNVTNNTPVDLYAANLALKFT